MRLTLMAGLAALALLCSGGPLPVSTALAASELRFDAVPPPPPLSAADQAEVARVEKYLNGIKTMRSKFIQVSPSGKQATGVFSLSRPGKMRLDYDPPVKDFVVSDGLFIFYWDGEMRQQSSAPVGSSMADIILRKDVKLSGEVTVKEVMHDPAALEVTLVESKDPGKGAITLIFQDKPLQLSRWRVRDAQGLETEVGLLDPKFGLKLDPEQFYFREPANPNADNNFR